MEDVSQIRVVDVSLRDLSPSFDLIVSCRVHGKTRFMNVRKE